MSRDSGQLFDGESVASSDMTWLIALDQYSATQRAAGRSPGTINLHRHYLRGLAAVQPLPWTVTYLDLVDYLGRDGWAPETRKSARAAIRGFYRWGVGVGYVERDPADRLPAVTVPKAAPRPAPELLVESLVKRDDRVGFMARLAAYAGLRASEIARVRGSDLLDGDVLRVLGKGQKVRYVPVVNRRLLVQLRDLTGWAFPSPAGGHLTPGHVGRLLSESLPQGWTAHTLRHRFATVAYDGTRDLLTVSELLGHARPETTQRYVRLSADALRAAVSAAS